MAISYHMEPEKQISIVSTDDLQECLSKILTVMHEYDHLPTETIIGFLELVKHSYISGALTEDEEE